MSLSFSILARPALVLALCLAAVTATAAPQQGDDSARSKVSAELQARINQAIAEGVDAVLRQQEIDGSWRHQVEGYRNGQTALALYTLVKCDLPRHHPALARAVAFLNGKAPTRTYSAALQLLALAELDAEAHEASIAELADLLVGWQRGGWGYPDAEVDLSNTQYVALALRMAAKCGVRISDNVWERLVDWTLEQQESADEVAGFRYRPNTDATGSMTSAGIAVLAIAREQKGKKNRSLDGALERGMAWMARNFSVDPNPLTPFDGRATDAKNGGHLYYYIYGLERVGALMSTPTFGEHDWYLEGATWLLERQEANGRWGNQADTCFALLFLSRATAKVRYTGAGIASDSKKIYGGDDSSRDVSLRGSGDQRLTLWISSYGRRALEDFEWEGEEGRGLRVARVEYLALDPTAEDGERVLETVAGRPDRPAGKERFAIRLEPERSGELKVFARVYVLPPDLPPGAGEDEYEPLESATLTVDILRADDPRLDEYAQHAGDNLLTTARAKITASSQRHDNRAPARAIDGAVGTGWFAALDDAAPWIEIECSRAIRAERIALSHATDEVGGEPAKPENRPPRIRRVRLVFDDSKDAYEQDMDLDPRVKTEIELPRARKFKKLRVVVLEIEPGPKADVGVGFAEIELFGRRRR